MEDPATAGSGTLGKSKFHQALKGRHIFEDRRTSIALSGLNFIPMPTQGCGPLRGLRPGLIWSDLSS